MKGGGIGQVRGFRLRKFPTGWEFWLLQKTSVTLVLNPGEKMENAIIAFVGFVLLCAPVLPQGQPRELKGGGHLLGETVEQFFSIGSVGELVRACEEKDWKTVKHLAKTSDHELKVNAKEICERAAVVKQQAASGARQEYGASGDKEMMRTDTFTLDGGHLVKIRMIYAMPIADIEGFHPKSFDELFAGLREAYGEPSKSYSEPVVNTYGVTRDAHRATWLGKQNVISIIEQPGEHSWTEIVAETLAEYNRETQAPKAANPLQ